MRLSFFPMPPTAAKPSKPVTLTTPVAALPGVTPRQAELLAEFGLSNLGKLIAHLPMRHEVLEAEQSVSELTVGHNVSARGEIMATRTVRRGKPRFEAVLSDGTGRLDLVWFNQAYLEKKLLPGMRIRVQGPLKRRGPQVQIVNAAYTVLRDDKDEPAARQARVRPVYPASEACPSRLIERTIQDSLALALPLLEDHLPGDLLAARQMPALADAYRMIHEPAHEGEATAGRRRLAYDELLLLQLGVHLKRAHLRQTLKAPALRHSAAIDRHIRARFPFALTPSQDAVVAEIARDLSRDTPTNRLIQGDVGSGKTVVALYGMLMAVAGGHQAVLMSPTEILAEQHFNSISTMLEGSRVRVRLLTGSAVPAERRAILAGLASGEIDIVIGTHAMITGAVAFKSLAVAVIDEQHRFGVHQRARLRSKGAVKGGPDAGEITPHVLVMTATPIPRTLAITLFGDLDISIIAGLPAGRRPITTRVVEAQARAMVYPWLRKRLDAGEQAFIVVPAIDGAAPGDDERADSPGAVTGVRALLKELEEGPLKGKRLGAMHGRLKRETREATMDRFRRAEIDALVATTVIEVGVDVPNATIMVVEHADRFGLAQLHQLRGRVGRGGKDSVCVLIGDPASDEARERLNVMKTVRDGFALAEKDFDIRGFGEMFGTRQSGMPPFKVADLSRDRALLAIARRDAAAWIEGSPLLARPEEALLRRRLWKSHGESLGLADVG